MDAVLCSAWCRPFDFLAHAGMIKGRLEQPDLFHE